MTFRSPLPDELWLHIYHFTTDMLTSIHLLEALGWRRAAVPKLDDYFKMPHLHRFIPYALERHHHVPMVLQGKKPKDMLVPPLFNGDDLKETTLRYCAQMGDMWQLVNQFLRHPNPAHYLRQSFLNEIDNMTAGEQLQFARHVQWKCGVLLDLHALLLEHFMYFEPLVKCDENPDPWGSYLYRHSGDMPVHYTWDEMHMEQQQESLNELARLSQM